VRRAAELERQREIAAEEAATMPNPSAREQSAMKKLLESYHLTEESIRPDGNCLYSAFASQIRRLRFQEVFADFGCSSQTG